MTKPKRGRPATERGAYNPNPARQLGRVSVEDWELLKSAAEKRGESFTQWAVAVLLRAAKRELSNKCQTDALKSKGGRPAEQPPAKHDK